MSYSTLFLGFLLGSGLGYLGGLFGIGGGIIAIPMLVLGFGMEQSFAQGTALVLMVPNLIVAWWQYNTRHPMQWKTTAAIACTATLTTWLVAHVAMQLPPLLLRQIFGAFLAALSIRLIRASKRPAESAQPHTPATPPLWGLAATGAIGGSVMGLLGIGGGLVAGPLLTGWLKQRQTIAQGFSLALVVPSSVVALATYTGAGRVNWTLGLPMALGGMLTVTYGVALAHRLPERTLRRAFAIMLLTTSCFLLLGPLLMQGVATK